MPIPYAALAFDRFYVEEQSGFLIAASGTQYAISYDYTQPRQISTRYPGSAVRSFDLHSLYYGCSQGVPQAECTITIVGVKAAPGSPHAGRPRTVTKVVTYPALVPPVDPSTLTLRKAEFGREWQRLASVSFSVTQDGAPAVYAGLVLDAVQYTTHECPS